MTAVDIEAFVAELAKASGEAIRPFFRTTLTMRDKSGGGAFDPVTEADRAAETTMRQMIMDTFPAHGIIGEEFPDHQADAEFVWVLDPIDGTKSFVSGFPTWGTLICLEHNGVPAYGLMHQPFIRERFAGDGARASWAGLNAHGTETLHHLRTRPCALLAEAITMTTSPALLSPDERERYAAVEAQARLARYGGDCYIYCMVAAGHVDLVVESGLKPYDVAALIPIVKGAGGVITNWSGDDVSKGGQVIAAGDPRIHEAALKLLNA
jgi:myo-inositol-1(or 4)-monophosphatase